MSHAEKESQEMGAAQPPPQTAAEPVPADLWARLRLPPYDPDQASLQNANELHSEGLSPLDRFAMAITDQVGSMGFFFLILTWTALWTGYNILAAEVKSLHWKAFDPFPAFVVYLLISNVIQLLLMPLIMVGQNLQARHNEIRAELDFEVNQKAEKEVMVVLRHLEHNADLLLQLMRHLECRISDEELRALTAERELIDRLSQVDLVERAVNGGGSAAPPRVADPKPRGIGRPAR
jgi:uncharacterized membrane protein